MAQAVFDEHPLEEYLRETGEGLEIMPGSTVALTQELEPFPLSFLTDMDDSSEPYGEWRPQFLIPIIQYMETLISTTQLTKPTNPLVERFKYNVISSSLLSPDLTTPHTYPHTPGRHHSIPGNLPHSRTSSELSQNQHPVVPTSCPPGSTANVGVMEAQHGPLSALTVAVAVLLSAGLTQIALLTMWAGLAWIYHRHVHSHTTRIVDLSPCLETLDELISANNDWESIVQEVVNTLEIDERNALGSSHTSVSSTLRVALNSTLQTTQTQCDNVRHLLSALTSPSDLSQLSEMYAPPSPIKPAYSLHDLRRPSSYPSSRPSPITSLNTSATSFTDHKRMTWNGPHSHSYSLGGGGGGGGFTSFSTPSPTMLARKRMRYRSDLSSLLGNSASTSATSSAPVTPAPSSPLARVSEDSPKPDADAGVSATTTTSTVPDDPFAHNENENEHEEGGHTSFAAAALKMQRQRTHTGIEVFSSSSPSSPCSSIPGSPPQRTRTEYGRRGRGHTLTITSPTSLLRNSTFLPSSKFTTTTTAIHHHHHPVSRQQPLSLSALRHALQAAVGAKRYACAHLLALRFSADEDPMITTTAATSSPSSPSSTTTTVMSTMGVGEGDNHHSYYWDDVKSVMGLLIGALSDAGARLSEALREVEVLRLRDQTPTPVGSIDGGYSPCASPDIRKLVMEKEGGRMRRLSGILLGTPGSGGSTAGSVSTAATAMATTTTVLGTGGGGYMGPGMVSFAPMPSQMCRFAGHVSTMQGALEDARKYLEECVHALKDDDPLSLDPVQDEKDATESGGGGIAEHHHPAVKAYEKLRRELGFALRECERGRSRLLDLVVKPPRGDVFDADLVEEEGEGGLPGLGHDSFSSESDKADVVVSPAHSEDGQEGGVVVNVVSGGGGDDDDDDLEREDDDASRDLLLGADVDHLPPAHVGIEQVFEADTRTFLEDEEEPVRMMKTKLSREERIKLVKARRESAKSGGLGLGVGLEPSPVIHSVREQEERGGGYEEKWGPSGDVVQELKDVIWKVGERRRKVQVQVQAQSRSPRFNRQDQTQQEEREREMSFLTPKRSLLPLSLGDDNPQKNPPSQSKLPSLIVSPRPRQPAARMSLSPLGLGSAGSLCSGGGGRESLDDLSPRPLRPQSLIPRRPSSMNIQSLLASLQLELPARKDEDECVLSSD